MNPNKLETEVDYDCCSISSSTSSVNQSQTTTTNNDQVVYGEPKRRIKKLRSIKISRLPSKKLGLRQETKVPSVVCSTSSVLSVNDYAPNYMKTTSSSFAKKETLQKSTRTLTRLSSRKLRRTNTRKSYVGGTDMKNNSRSIKNSMDSKATGSSVSVDVHSQASSRDPESSSGSNDVKIEITSNFKPVRVVTRASSFRPVRVLTKMASLRTKRSNAKRSQALESRISRATCSSALKGLKLLDNLEDQLGGGSEGEEVSVMKVCPYSYCSLHGHHHKSSDAPPLKRFISMRHRALKQKSTKSERKISATSEKDTSVKKRPRDRKIIVDKGPEDVETATSLTGEPVDSTAGSKTIASPAINSNTGKPKNVGLWSLVYRHIVPLNDVNNEAKEGQEDSGTLIETTESSSRLVLWVSDEGEYVEDQNGGNNTIKDYQYNAIKLVQEAFNKILAEIPDQSSDSVSSNSDTALEKEVPFSTSSDLAKDQTVQDREDLGHRADNLNVPKGNAAEMKLRNPSSWSNLKKILILKRFVKALERVKKIKPSKPRHLQGEPDPEAEKIQLRRLTMGDRKKSEEWMLDYALQQVVSKLDKAQKRKVALLVQAFETVRPQKPEPGTSPTSHVVSSPTEAHQSCFDQHDQTNYVIEDKEVLSAELKEATSAFEEEDAGPKEEATSPGDHQIASGISAFEAEDMGSKEEPSSSVDDGTALRSSAFEAEETHSKEETPVLVYGTDSIGDITSPTDDQTASGTLAFEMEGTGSEEKAANQEDDQIASANPGFGTQGTDSNEEATDPSDGNINSGISVFETEGSNPKEETPTSAEDHVGSGASEFGAEEMGSNKGAEDPSDNQVACDAESNEEAIGTDDDQITTGISSFEAEEVDSQLEPTSPADDQIAPGTFAFEVEGAYFKEEAANADDNQRGSNEELQKNGDSHHDVANEPPAVSVLNGEKLDSGTQISETNARYAGSDVPEIANEFTEGTALGSEIRNRLSRSLSQLGESENNKIGGSDEKQNYMRLWYMIYKHMQSGNATLLEPENGKGTLGTDFSDQNNTTHSANEFSAPNGDANKENHNSRSSKIEVDQQIKAIKLVEEAIDEIPLPDLPSNGENNGAEDKTGLVSPTETNAKPGVKRSWSNLKKVILLKRFVSAIEQVKKLNPRESRFLPLDPEKEREIVNLRHLEIGDRKNSDEWMIDYALQQVVAKLTPARKRKVELLVEAFETVIPTITT